MNVTILLTKEYKIRTLGQRRKNEPKTNLIKANFPKAKNERNYCFKKELQTTNYEQ
jgi:hypothetical protein